MYSLSWKTLGKARPENYKDNDIKVASESSYFVQCLEISNLKLLPIPNYNKQLVILNKKVIRYVYNRYNASHLPMLVILPVEGQLAMVACFDA